MQKPNLNGLNGKGYQPLSVPLPGCYQCGLHPGMLSERSRCAECERERADANAKENDQLREAAGLAKDQAEALREALDVANQEIKRLESGANKYRGVLVFKCGGAPSMFDDQMPRVLFGVLERSGLAYSPEESVREYAVRVVEKLAEVSAQAEGARRDARKWQEIAAAGAAEKEKEIAEKVERLSAATAERDQLRHAFLSLAGYFDEIKVRVPGVGDE